MKTGAITGGIKSDGDWITDHRTVRFQSVQMNGAHLDVVKRKPGLLSIHLHISAEDIFHSASVEIPTQKTGGGVSLSVGWDGKDCWRVIVEGVRVLSTLPGEEGKGDNG
jgi:hypothetical protein